MGASRNNITVALVGADGAGKTTVAQRVAARSHGRIEYIYLGMNAQSNRYALPTSRLVLAVKRRRHRKEVADKSEPEEPVSSDLGHRSSPDHPVFNTLRLINRLAEESFRWLIVKRAHRAGKSVISDRHFVLDHALGLVMGRPNAGRLTQRIHRWFLHRVYPRPDRVIFLDAPAELLYERKADAPLEYLEKRQGEYRQAAAQLDWWRSVDATGDLDEVVGAVESEIRQFLGPNAASAATAAPQAPAVIVGLDSVQGVQVARILAAKSVPVIGIAKDRHHYGSRSRAVDTLHYCNTANEDLIQLLEEIGPTLATRGVLIPCQDKNVLVVSRFRDRLSPWYHLVLPDHNVVEDLTDKGRFDALARDVGLDIPETATMASEEDAHRIADKFSFPLIVKPPNRAWGWLRLTTEKAIEVADRAELLDVFARFNKVTPVLLVQEWIAGADDSLFTCNVYFDRSATQLVSFVSRKIRQYPPQLGQGCSAVSVQDREIADVTRQFYEKVGLRGFGYLEMKRDANTGRLVTIEPNVGRPTGRSAIAETGGVELHYAMYCDAAGLELPVNLEQAAEPVKWFHLLRDLQSAVHYMRRGDLSWGEWLASMRGKKTFAVFSWRDPAPFFYALWRAVPASLSPRRRGAAIRR